jgi:hypothetical protein
MKRHYLDQTPGVPDSLGHWVVKSNTYESPSNIGLTGSLATDSVSSRQPRRAWRRDSIDVQGYIGS